MEAIAAIHHCGFQIVHHLPYCPDHGTIRLLSLSIAKYKTRWSSCFLRWWRHSCNGHDG